MRQKVFEYDTIFISYSSRCAFITSEKQMEISKGNILIIDDDYDVLKSAQLFLRRFFRNVFIEQVPDNIIHRFSSEDIDVVLLDMNYQKGRRDGEEGFYWLNEIIRNNPETVVILITAYGDIELAIKAIKAGATDFVLKPWKNQKLLATVSAALSLRNSRDEIKKLRLVQQQLINDWNKAHGEFIGSSPAILKTLSVVKKVATTSANVLLLGENGTGKELLARTLYRLSDRKDKMFISVDLGAISETLFESDLFGHVKGAYTDAIEDKPGRFELASGGTIFLDEIGNLSISLQAKLLSVLQNKRVMRVGSTKEIPVDFRLICATNMDLQQMIKEGKFREDLFYRINTVEINVPSLRERKEDIPLLFIHFFNQFSTKYNKSGLKTHPGTIEKLQHYEWPGNVREFQHCIERAIILSERKEIMPDEFLPPTHASRQWSNQQEHRLDQVEKNHILEIIEKNGGNITKAAKDLGISRSSLHRRLKKYDL